MSSIASRAVVRPLQNDPLQSHDVPLALGIVELTAAAEGGLAHTQLLLVHERISNIETAVGLRHLRDLADLDFLRHVGAACRRLS